MFNKKEDIQYSRATTIIGENCKFEGQLRATGTIRIDGEFNGEMFIEGNLYIGEKGNISGNIKTSNLLVSGKIKGNVEAKEQLRISPGGSLLGDVRANTFILDENAYFEGNCKMSKSNTMTTGSQEEALQ
ncbi:bactofilin family protein [Alkaliphilus hydrothermalis]|uniref:Cytoskeletal protein CcmA (Bactofilin family) n=1 Tax=Alkaliphilus hydrothermalis TaxID=1482730 RepID=A0ABS2NPH2_9FIRM|nr:polymer-forming cytoskeletal protein [Alkaliphilus hydrothermalis]MBM7614849.1 cytoskeletal protein CcmA (bactofilin family) [Alkaliphilus hydrothermalis]